MNYLEIFGFIHAAFYLGVGFIFIVRCVGKSIKNKQFFELKELNER